eukprot:CAMPEP_0170085148 /NCGR_PEP_ID=MMETSP0019_2-20121128/20111_1 /TAXON_ID=98059 /ORGANISM="Dinobryon sp., Strain UTEXLB2267" /LENGTH=651 /DNA_ID=CAMNT_0010301479 /DNA_START=630 /DNA_END=2585 /DNA_ORIENTATION=+
MRETLINSGHEIDEDQCVTLFRAIASHPFAKLISKNSAATWDNNTLPTAANISMEFNEWRHQLQQLRSLSDRMPLLLRLPELDRVFRILLGDATLLQDLTLTSCQQWPRLALAQLLYVHPPPLSRTDLARLLQRAVVAASVRAQQQPQDGSPPELGQGAILELLGGNAVPILQSLQQRGLSGLGADEESLGALAGSCRDLHLACAALLTQLLVVGCDEREPLRQVLLDTHADEESFRESLFGQLAHRLLAADYPWEAVLGCLGPQVSPQAGEALSRCLLARRAPSSDADCLLTASLLLRRGGAGAASLLTARAMHWWRHANNSRQTGPSCRAKAVQFFCLAGNMQRLHAALEASIAQLLQAVGCCEVLAGLQFCPQVKDETGAGEAAGPLPSDLSDVLKEAKMVLSAAGGCSLAEELAEAEGVAVQRLQPPGSLQGLDALRSQLLVRALGGLVEALSAVLSASEEDQLVRSRQLRDASSILASLLVPLQAASSAWADSLPLLPSRFWLPLLELIARLHGQACPAVSSASSDKMPQQECGVTKEAAYGLLQRLQDCLRAGHHSADSPAIVTLRTDLLAVLSASILAENKAQAASKTKQQQQRSSRPVKMGFEERLQQLKAAYFTTNCSSEYAAQRNAAARDSLRHSFTKYAS